MAECKHFVNLFNTKPRRTLLSHSLYVSLAPGPLKVRLEIEQIQQTEPGNFKATRFRGLGTESIRDGNACGTRPNHGINHFPTGNANPCVESFACFAHDPKVRPLALFMLKPSQLGGLICCSVEEYLT